MLRFGHTGAVVGAQALRLLHRDCVSAVEIWCMLSAVGKVILYSRCQSWFDLFSFLSLLLLTIVNRWHCITFNVAIVLVWVVAVCSYVCGL